VINIQLFFNSLTLFVYLLAHKEVVVVTVFVRWTCLFPQL
jgi:hypothetical protein